MGLCRKLQISVNKNTLNLKPLSFAIRCLCVSTHFEFVILAFKSDEAF
jgi:hypothetical protein